MIGLFVIAFDTVGEDLLALANEGEEDENYSATFHSGEIQIDGVYDHLPWGMAEKVADILLGL